MPFSGRDDPAGGDASQEKAVTNAPAPAAPAGPPPWAGPQAVTGEAEFLRGEYAAALPRLTGAFQEGDPRAAYYMRVILQYGLQGGVPDGAGSGSASQAMAARYQDIKTLASTAHESQRPIYNAALAYLQYTGLVPGEKRDPGLAVTHVRYAVSNDFRPALNLLAAIGCEADVSVFFGIWSIGKGDCYKSTLDAAEGGDILAMGNLSALYREGTGTSKDPLRAVSWAHKAALMNPPSARAQNDMGYFYETGTAVSKDAAEARRYYTLAQKRYPLARSNLDRLRKSGKDGPAISSSIDY
jgi:TPR repeat protein